MSKAGRKETKRSRRKILTPKITRMLACILRVIKYGRITTDQIESDIKKDVQEQLDQEQEKKYYGRSIV